MVATIAPGPASSGVPSGTRATLEVRLARSGRRSCRSAVPARPAAAAARRRPAAPAGRRAGSRAGSARRPRRPRSRPSASATACHAARFAVAGGHRAGQREEDRHHARRVGDHQQGHENLAEQLEIHRITVAVPRATGSPGSAGTSDARVTPGAAATIRSYTSTPVVYAPSRTVLCVPWKSEEPVTNSPSSAGEGSDLRPLRRRVVLVVGLQTGQPGRGQLDDQRVRHDPPPPGGPRMGEDRHPARLPGPAATARKTSMSSLGSRYRSPSHSRRERLRGAGRPDRPGSAPARCAGGRRCRRRRTASTSVQLTSMPSARSSVDDPLARGPAGGPDPGQLGDQLRCSGSNRYASRCSGIDGSAPYQRQDSSAPRIRVSPGGSARRPAPSPRWCRGR